VETVVASAVGGIPIQIIHKHTGLLAHSVEGTAARCNSCSHPEIAQNSAKWTQHVKENFLLHKS
jgi:trehalose synthase